MWFRLFSECSLLIDLEHECIFTFVPGMNRLHSNIYEIVLIFKLGWKSSRKT